MSKGGTSPSHRRPTVNFSSHIASETDPIEIDNLSAVSLSPKIKPTVQKEYADNSWTTMASRHSFLLSTLAVLLVLCTIYLYYAVSLDYVPGCEGKWGAELEACKSILAMDADRV